MSGYVVYADILLTLNFVLDFFLLWAAGRFLRREIRYRRLIPAAALGAAYGGAMLLPIGHWLFSVPLAVLLSLLMLAVAYPWQGPLAALRLTAVFYLIACAMGGAALAGAYLLDRSGYAVDAHQAVKVGALVFGLFMALVLARRGAAAWRRNWRREEFRATVEIRVDGKCARLAALIDTGNDLHEPLSGLPVLVADYQALRPLFSPAFRDGYSGCGGDPVRLLKRLEREDKSWSKRLRLVPFRSIGKSHGLMAGFRPDLLQVEQGGQCRLGLGVICIAPGGLSSGGEFQAVINPELAAGEEKTGGIRA